MPYVLVLTLSKKGMMMKEVFNPMYEEPTRVKDDGTDGELCSVGFICVPGGGLIALALLAHL